MASSRRRCAETPAGPLRLRTLLPGSSLRLGLPFTWPRPARTESRSLAFWQILARLGHETSVLGWPAAAASEGDDRLELFRVDPSHLDRPLVRSLVPAGLSADLAARTTLRAAAEDLTILGAALGTPPQGPSNVLVLVLSGTTLVSRPFGAAGDAHYWGLPVPDAGPKSRALDAYYRFLDDLLHELLERQGRDRTICVFSPVSLRPAAAARRRRRVRTGRAPLRQPGRGGRRIPPSRGRGDPVGSSTHLGAAPRPRADASRPRRRADGPRHGRPGPRGSVRRALRPLDEHPDRHDLRAGRPAVARVLRGGRGRREERGGTPRASRSGRRAPRPG